MYLKGYYNAGVDVLGSVLNLIYNHILVREQVKVNRKVSKRVEKFPTLSEIKKEDEDNDSIQKDR